MASQATLRIMTTARVNLPGVLDAAMQLELFSLFDEFLQTTDLWKEDITFVVNTTDLEYQIVPSSGTIIRFISLMNSDEVPVSTSMEIPGVLLLQREQSQIDTYTAKVVLTVTDPIKRDGYPVIPDWILTKYHMVLADGLMGRMMAQKAKPYTDERLSIYRLRRFRNGMAAARADNISMNVNGGQAWRFPKFA